MYMQKHVCSSRQDTYVTWEHLFLPVRMISSFRRWICSRCLSWDITASYSAVRAKQSPPHLVSFSYSSSFPSMKVAVLIIGRLCLCLCSLLRFLVWSFLTQISSPRWFPRTWSRKGEGLRSERCPRISLVSQNKVWCLSCVIGLADVHCGNYRWRGCVLVMTEPVDCLCYWCPEVDSSSFLELCCLCQHLAHCTDSSLNPLFPRKSYPTTSTTFCILYGP